MIISMIYNSVIRACIKFGQVGNCTCFDKAMNVITFELLIDNCVARSKRHRCRFRFIFSSMVTPITKTLGCNRKSAGSQVSKDYPATANITAPALKTAVTAKPFLRPRVSTLSLVTVAATCSPPPSSISTSALTAPGLT